ncbi:MAG: AAA family ATPase [Nitrosopumilaceae archaeon]
MIKTLEIKNFKSIKHLKLDCKRVNVFIGKPNTGKSNLLESVGIFSLPYVREKLNDIVRFENMTNLFHDQDLSQNIEITTDAFSTQIRFQNGKFKATHVAENRHTSEFYLDYEGKLQPGGSTTSLVKFYRFAILDKFARQESDFLLPPKGENLLQILLTNKDLRRVVADLFGEYGLKIVLKPQEHKIETQKEIDDIIISSPYSLVSDTLQRVVFYLVVIETNKDSTIIFE